MSPQQEIVWRHAWLRTVVTNGERSEQDNVRPVQLRPRMTLARRLEKLHRLRTALEPPRSWFNKN